ncbi:MAG: DUF4136 domain-containing protein [Bacteroidia bacterium]|nr:DUF4136 domain-containing protein [Bacteroidia bacterium]
MKTNFLKLILPAMLMIFMVGCASIKVSTDYDRKADFSKYKTFNFSKEVDKVTLNDLNRRRLKDAISKEMQAKGFQISTTPDVLVNAFVKGKTKYSATANTFYNGGMYYRGFGSSSTYVDVNKSIEGTLFIDLIDVQEKKMIWEGVAEGLVNPRTETREDKINSVVAMIFKNFPQ